MLHAGIVVATPGFIQNLRERGEEERMDANEKGRDEKGTSGSHRASATSWKVYFCDMTLNLNRTRCISLDFSSPKGTFSQDNLQHVTKLLFCNRLG